MAQVYVNSNNAKRSIWSLLHVIPSIDHDAGSVIVPGRAGRKMTAEFEDVRVVPADNPFLTLVENSIDELDTYIDKIVAGQDNKSIHEQSPKYKQSLNAFDDGDCNVRDFSDKPVMWPNMSDHVKVFWSVENVY